MNLLVVQLDDAIINVLRPRWGDLSLVWQAQEGFFVDEEDEEVSFHVVIKGQLPS